MPLASDVQAGATVRLASALTSGGWDPGLGPPRRQPARRPPLRRHSNLRRYERLSAAAQAEERKVDGAPKRPAWASGWASGRLLPGPEPEPRGQQRAAQSAAEESSALWAWRRRSPIDIERMLASQRDDRAYHAREAELLGTDWPMPSDRGANSRLWPETKQLTSWELEAEFHLAAARTAELRQQLAEREERWAGFLTPHPQEPRQALAVYEQQRQLLKSLRTEAEYLRDAVAAQGAGQCVGVGVGARPLL